MIPGRSISLGSTNVMEFSKESCDAEQQFLEPMSALVIAGEARHEWKHGIPARAADEWQGREWPRARRVSLTFRKLLRNRLQPTSSSE